MRFPCNKEHVLVDFLCEIADGSERPKSQVSSCVAALGCLFQALAVENTAQSRTVSMLVDGLVKSASMKPMVKTPIMPIKPFLQLFESWDVNANLSVKCLRLKVICLLALVFMLRPSDIAPHARYLDPETLMVEQLTFGSDQVHFKEDGRFTLTFHGIKNDYCRDGFGVTLPPSSAPKLDPGKCLRDYIERTGDERERVPGRPVFLSLRRPYKVIGANSVSSILNDAIALAGLSNKGFSAKCFRPTAATCAINSGLKSDIARHVGRWRNAEVFEKHYVHSEVPQGYTDSILK